MSAPLHSHEFNSNAAYHRHTLLEDDCMYLWIHANASHLFSSNCEYSLSFIMAHSIIVRVAGMSGDLCSFGLEEIEEPRNLWNVATVIKRRSRIRRGEQRLLLEDVELCFTELLPQSSGGEILLTLVRSKIRCACCNRKEKRRRHKLCSNCMVARYCSHICQEQHWERHKVTCKSSPPGV